MHAYDDLDAFDDFDAFDDHPADGAPHAGGAFGAGDLDDGEGAFGSAAAAAMARVLVSGETGLRFESLVLFAQPLFEAYDLDPAEAFTLTAAPDRASDDVVAVLQTARVLWAYFALPPPARARRRSRLAAFLIGPELTDDDWVDLDALLETVEPYWSALLHEEREAAETAGQPALDFDRLLQHPAFHLDGDAAEAGYGPDRLGEMEARALFAQPLLEASGALADPDAFEAAMDRANTLWALAHQPPDERDRRLAALVAERNGEAAHLRREADVLFTRFAELFPEHVV